MKTKEGVVFASFIYTFSGGLGSDMLATRFRSELKSIGSHSDQFMHASKHGGLIPITCIATAM